MPINLSLITGTSGDYSLIGKGITPDDAIIFVSIYEAIEAHAIAQEKTILEYVTQGVCVAIEGYSIPAIGTLKAVGIIQSGDNVHIGITVLGYGFYQFIQA